MVYKVKSNTPAKKLGRKTPAKTLETGMPRSAQKRVPKNAATPQKAVKWPNKSAPSSGTPRSLRKRPLEDLASPEKNAPESTRSNRRKSVAVCQVTESPGTPSRVSRRASQIPKRYQEDSSGDDFEQKTKNRLQKKAKAGSESPNVSSKKMPTGHARLSQKVSIKLHDDVDDDNNDADQVESSGDKIFFCGRKQTDSDYKGPKNRSKSSLTNPAAKRLRKGSKAKKVETESEDKILSEESSSGENSSDDFEEEMTPKKGHKSVSKNVVNTPKSISKKRMMTPRIPERNIKLPDSVSPLQEAQLRLHVGAVPDNLPCRENEFAEIFSFTEGKIQDGVGGCMYISGVPGWFNLFF